MFWTAPCCACANALQCFQLCYSAHCSCKCFAMFWTVLQEHTARANVSHPELSSTALTPDTKRGGRRPECHFLLWLGSSLGVGVLANPRSSCNRWLCIWKICRTLSNCKASGNNDMCNVTLFFISALECPNCAIGGDIVFENMLSVEKQQVKMILMFSCSSAVAFTDPNMQ